MCVPHPALRASRALIERPYSREYQAVGAVYDRPGFLCNPLNGRTVQNSLAPLPGCALDSEHDPGCRCAPPGATLPAALRAAFCTPEACAEFSPG